MRIAAILAVIGLIAVTAPAQTKYIVSPGAYATVDAPGGNTYPWYKNPLSYLQVHDDLAGKTLILTELSFRRDTGLSGPVPYPAFIVNITLRFSTAATTSGSVSPTFALNHGPDLLEVLTGANVNFPATTPPAAPPAAWEYVIPFAQKPFLFTGTGSLCWEVRVHTTTSVGANYMDDVTIRSTRLAYGKGCIASDQTSPAKQTLGGVDPNTSPPHSWLAYSYTSYLAKNQPFIWWIGVDNKTWSGYPLPLDLAPLGGTGCSIYLAPVFALGGTTSSTGLADTRVTGPFIFSQDPLLLGFKFFSQLFSLDPGNAAFPLVFTDGLEIVIPTVLEPVSRIYANNDDKAATGSINASKGLLIRLGYK